MGMKCEAVKESKVYDTGQCLISNKQSPYNNFVTDEQGVIQGVRKNGDVVETEYDGLTIQALPNNGLVKYAKIAAVYFTGADIQSIAEKVLKNRFLIALDAGATEKGQIGIKADQSDELVKAMQVLVDAINDDKCSTIFSKDGETKCKKLLESLQTYAQENFKAVEVPKTTAQKWGQWGSDQWKMFKHYATPVNAGIGVLSSAVIAFTFSAGTKYFAHKFRKSWNDNDKNDKDPPSPPTGDSAPKGTGASSGASDSVSLNRDMLDDPAVRAVEVLTAGKVLTSGRFLSTARVIGSGLARFGAGALEVGGAVMVRGASLATAPLFLLKMPRMGGGDDNGA
jgi:hypothetical protein